METPWIKLRKIDAGPNFEDRHAKSFLVLNSKREWDIARDYDGGEWISPYVGVKLSNITHYLPITTKP